MTLPEAVKAIRARYVARFPIPQGAPGDVFEERVRQWSIAFAEQVAFEQGPQWGMKRADKNRPISKDTITLYGDEALYVWDLLSGAGTGSPKLVDDPESMELTDQVFVRVTETNHLGVPEPPPVVPPSPVDLSPIVAELQAIKTRLDAIERGYQATVENFADLGKALDEVRGQIQPPPAPTKQPIAWIGALGYRIRLTPEY